MAVAERYDRRHKQLLDEL